VKATEASEVIVGLFDAPVAAAVADACTELDALTELEAAHVGPRWAEKRLWEFRAGRHCARRALARLGADHEVLRKGVPSGEQGVPRWPAGFVGSITHTGRGPTHFAASAVTRAARSLGLDAELDLPLRHELWQRVLTPDERRRAQASCAPAEQRGRYALLVFSAKEAFFKAVFPLSGVFLGFHDVVVDFDASPGATGLFHARPRKDLGPSLRETSYRGRYVRVAELVMTGVTLLAP